MRDYCNWRGRELSFRDPAISSMTTAEGELQGARELRPDALESTIIYFNWGGWISSCSKVFRRRIVRARAGLSNTVVARSGGGSAVLQRQEVVFSTRVLQLPFRSGRSTWRTPASCYRLWATSSVNCTPCPCHGDSTVSHADLALESRILRVAVHRYSFPC